jgi:hypothetical protein
VNEFRGVLDMQIGSLLDALQAQREHRCREIRDAAEQEAARLIGQNRGKLRARLRRAVREERNRRQAALLEARRRLETRQRHATQAHYKRLLRAAWPALLDELRRRWTSAEERRAWCEMLCDEARRILANEAWTIEHPADWSDADSRWLCQALDASGLPEPDLRCATDIVAGLRIRQDNACLDGTLEGLLTRRPVLEAQFLAEWERLSTPTTDDPHG